MECATSPPKRPRAVFPLSGSGLKWRSILDHFRTCLSSNSGNARAELGLWRGVRCNAVELVGTVGLLGIAE